jgi:hypothetical protein
MTFLPTSKASLGTILLAAIFALTCLAPGAADAKRKKKRKKKRAAPVAKISSEALGQLMGPFNFGMSKTKVLKILSRQLDERFEDKIKDTSDIAEQDQLRRKKKTMLKKVKASYVSFEGKKTGWDVSIIDDQFGHKTGESMLVYWENNADGNDQRRFFFFHEGNLFKMYIALNSSMLPQEQRSFDFFKSLMIKRYGPGKLVTHKKRSGDVVPVLVDWAAPKYHVQAIDKVSFYGSFCLMIADPSVEAAVMVARDENKVAKTGNAVIESMLEGDETPPSLDNNKNALDSALRN